MPKCGKNKSGIRAAGQCITDVLRFLPHLFDVICDLLLSICTATRNLFVKLAMELVVLDVLKKKKQKKMVIIKMMVTIVTKCQLQNNNSNCDKN